MKLLKIRLPFKLHKPVLAMGSQVKNTLCFAKGNFAYISPVLGNLSSPEDFLSFERAARYFLKKRPEVIAADLHPEYQSTKYASRLSAKRYELSFIQHHHAHIVSCMAENGLKNHKVIGVALDGTGLGPDGEFWGAEFLYCDYKKFFRAAHLKEIPLLGAEKAISEPWRLAAAWLYQAYKDNFLNLKIGFLRKLDKKKWRILKKMHQSGFNSPLASSMGRLFDAAGALILGKDNADFQGQLAIELEKKAKGYTLNAIGYPFRITQKKNIYIIDPASVFKGIVSDLKNNTAKEKIAYRFHLSAAEMVAKACALLKKESGINKVVLAGGVFQNKLLLRLSLDLLYKLDFHVFIHRFLPCNDSAVSLGEAVIAGMPS